MQSKVLRDTPRDIQNLPFPALRSLGGTVMTLPLPKLTTIGQIPQPPPENRPDPGNVSVERPIILILGPTPPPFHGVSIAMRTLLQSHISVRFRVVTLDTADRRDITHVENPDWQDVVLFVRQFFKNVYLLARYKPALFYLPICQTRLGFLRDTLFMIPAFLVGSRVVVHLHGGMAFAELFEQGGALWRRVMTVILRRVARFLVLGEVHRPIFARWVSPHSISVVPNGIEELPVPTAESSSIAPHKRKQFRIVYLSTLSQGKGLFILLEAMRLIVHQFPDVECAIAGPWWRATTQIEAEEMVAKLDLAETVSFVGSVTGDKKAAFLRTGDLFVFPSMYRLEGQPLVILEAMCAGLPVIASDIGSLSETIDDGITGFIVPQNNPEAVCDRVLQLLRDPTLRQSMGKAARARYEQHYTSRAFADRIEEALLNTLERGQSPELNGRA